MEYSDKIKNYIKAAIQNGDANLDVTDQMITDYVTENIKFDNTLSAMIDEQSLDDIIASDEYTQEEKDLALDIGIEAEQKRNQSTQEAPAQATSSEPVTSTLEDGSYKREEFYPDGSIESVLIVKDDGTRLGVSYHENGNIKTQSETDAKGNSTTTLHDESGIKTEEIETKDGVSQTRYYNQDGTIKETKDNIVLESGAVLSEDINAQEAPTPEVQSFRDDFDFEKHQEEINNSNETMLRDIYKASGVKMTYDDWKGGFVGSIQKEKDESGNKQMFHDYLNHALKQDPTIKAQEAQTQEAPEQANEELNGYSFEELLTTLDSANEENDTAKITKINEIVAQNVQYYSNLKDPGLDVDQLQSLSTLIDRTSPVAPSEDGIIADETEQAATRETLKQRFADAVVEYDNEFGLDKIGNEDATLVANNLETMQNFDADIFKQVPQTETEIKPLEQIYVTTNKTTGENVYKKPEEMSVTELASYYSHEANADKIDAHLIEEKLKETIKKGSLDKDSFKSFEFLKDHLSRFDNKGNNNNDKDSFKSQAESFLHQQREKAPKDMAHPEFEGAISLLDNIDFGSKDNEESKRQFVEMARIKAMQSLATKKDGEISQQEFMAAFEENLSANMLAIAGVQSVFDGKKTMDNLSAGKKVKVDENVFTAYMAQQSKKNDAFTDRLSDKVEDRAAAASLEGSSASLDDASAKSNPKFAKLKAFAKAGALPSAYLGAGVMFGSAGVAVIATAQSTIEFTNLRKKYKEQKAQKALDGDKYGIKDFYKDNKTEVKKFALTASTAAISWADTFVSGGAGGAVVSSLKAAKATFGLGLAFQNARESYNKKREAGASRFAAFTTSSIGLVATSAGFLAGQSEAIDNVTGLDTMGAVEDVRDAASSIFEGDAPEVSADNSGQSVSGNPQQQNFEQQGSYSPGQEELGAQASAPELTPEQLEIKAESQRLLSEIHPNTTMGVVLGVAPEDCNYTSEQVAEILKSGKLPNGEVLSAEQLARATALEQEIDLKTGRLSDDYQSISDRLNGPTVPETPTQETPTQETPTQDASAQQQDGAQNLGDQSASFLTGAGNAVDATYQDQILGEFMNSNTLENGTTAVQSISEDGRLNYQFFNQEGQEIAPPSDYFGNPDKQAAYEQAYADRLGASTEAQAEQTQSQSQSRGGLESDVQARAEAQAQAQAPEAPAQDAPTQDTPTQDTPTQEAPVQSEYQTTPSGVTYKIGEDGFCAFEANNVAMDTRIRGEIPKFRDAEGNIQVGLMDENMSRRFMNLETMNVNEIGYKEQIAADLLNKESLSAGEKMFIEEHNQNIHNLGLIRDEEGRLVENPNIKEMVATQDALAQENVANKVYQQKLDNALEDGNIDRKEGKALGLTKDDIKTLNGGAKLTPEQLSGLMRGVSLEQQAAAAQALQEPQIPKNPTTSSRIPTNSKGSR